MGSTTLLHYTPLPICAHAVRTCWQSFGMGDDGGPKDLALIDKVGNKLKHSSTLEHLIIGMESDDELVVKVFRENEFSNVTPSANGQMISTNFRALQELQIPQSLKVSLAPKEYGYLLGIGDCNSVRHPEYPVNVGSDIATLLYVNDIKMLEKLVWDEEPHIHYSLYLQNISRALLQELARHRKASLSVKSTRYTLKELKKEGPFCGAMVNLSEPSRVIGTDDIERARKYLVFTGDAHTDASSIVELELLRRNVVKGTANDISKFNLPDAYKTELTWTISAKSLQNFLYLRTPPSAMWEIRRMAYRICDALPANHKDLYADCVHADRP
ncbi:MAG: FAD-dependent thymidylate synthase [Zetaproteobacteria bacterium]|nr:FAD-dependent thymidylate synthase [Zetaproteobacteria bacterium]